MQHRHENQPSQTHKAIQQFCKKVIDTAIHRLAKEICSVNIIKNAWKKRHEAIAIIRESSVRFVNVRKCLRMIQAVCPTNILLGIPMGEESLRLNCAAILIQSYYREKCGRVHEIPRAVRVRCLTTQISKCANILEKSQLYKKALSIARGINFVDLNLQVAYNEESVKG